MSTLDTKGNWIAASGSELSAPPGIQGLRSSITKWTMLLAATVIVSSCTTGKSLLLKYDMVGLSSENVFAKGKDAYFPSDFRFKTKFNPSDDGTVYYYVTLYRGTIRSDFDLKTVWFDPQGKKIETIETRHEAKLVATDSRLRATTFYHDLPISSLASKPGEWKVDLYIDGELAERRAFTVLSTSEHGTGRPAIESTQIGGARVYEGISVSEIGRWKPTGIVVPAGAIVAVSAQGEIRDKVQPDKLRFPPWRCLRFKIGNGPVIQLRSGADSRNNPHNMIVIQSATAGALNFWISLTYPKQKEGQFAATVLIWDQEHQDRMEDDITTFIKSRPGDPQLRNLWFRMAVFLRNDAGDPSRAEAIFEKLRSEPGTWSDEDNSDIWTASADNENLLGRAGNAKTYAGKGLEFAERCGNKNLRSQALLVIGRASSRQGHNEEALLFFDDALEMAKQAQDITLCGQIHSSMGYTLLRLNKSTEASAHFSSALEYLKKSDTRSARPTAYLGLGDAQFRLNRKEEAKKSYEAALIGAERISNVDAMWRAHSGLGRIAYQAGDLSSAFDHYATAIMIVEGMRAKIRDPELRASFTENKLFVYERMIQLLQRMKRDPEALNYLERAKARNMLDMLQDKGFSSRKKEEEDLLIEERSVRKRMDLLSMQSSKLPSETGMPSEYPSAEDTEETADDLREIRRLETERQSILERIEKLNPELASLLSVRPLKAEEIQDLLGPDTLLLEYFLGRETRLVFGVTKEKVVSVPLAPSPKMLFEKTKELRAKVEDRIGLEGLGGEAYKRSLAELYEVLIRPVEVMASGKKHLVIVPHGVLHYLPFHALISGDGRYLIESFTVSYLPSASILKYARMKNKGNKTELFAVANPSTDLAPLPGAEVEAQEISALYPKHVVLTGKQATETSVKTQSPNYDLLLFSTHGEMIESDPMKSDLRFASAGSDDGRLTVSEIFDMEVKANLVTLSACETALAMSPGGAYPQGDDLVGLSRAFIHAGTPTVVASLWSVSDYSTVALMRFFFQNLKTLPKAEALRLAQLELMKSRVALSIQRGTEEITLSARSQPGMSIDCSHPYYWAPFILLGDWR